MRVASIGECMIELSEHPDGTLTRAFGGDTLNTALYLARLGVATDYVTALGADPFSEALLAAWTAEGIGTELVLRVPDALPGLYLIRTDDVGERTFHYWRDSAPVRRLFGLAGIHAVAAAVASRDLVYLSGVTLSLFDAAGREGLFALLDRVRANGGRVAFDTNFRPRGWPEAAVAHAAFDGALARADLVFAGIEDWALLHGPLTDRALLAALQRRGVAEIVVKLSVPSCRVFAGGTDELVAASPVDTVIDTTAAGDSFAAGYIAARSRGAESAAAAGAAHRLAGAVIRHRGAIIPPGAMPGAT